MCMLRKTEINLYSHQLDLNKRKISWKIIKRIIGLNHVNDKTIILQHYKGKITDKTDIYIKNNSAGHDSISAFMVNNTKHLFRSTYLSN